MNSFVIIGASFACVRLHQLCSTIFPLQVVTKRVSGREATNVYAVVKQASVIRSTFCHVHNKEQILRNYVVTITWKRKIKLYQIESYHSSLKFHGGTLLTTI